MKPNLVRSQGTRFDQTLDLISGCNRIADREIQQRPFFYELCTREIDACFVICASCSLVVFIGFINLAPLAVKISVSLERVCSRRYEVEELTSLNSLVQVPFARRKVTKVEVTVGHVEMRSCLLWHWNLVAISQHASKPSESFAKITPHHCRESEVVSNQPDIAFIIRFLGQL
jgi:hypothetical protein